MFTTADTPEQVVSLIYRILLEFLGSRPEKHVMRLMVGTVAAESGFTKRIQDGGGPARGLFQIEPATAFDNYAHHLKYIQWLHRYANMMRICFSLSSAPFFVPTNEEIEHLLTVHDPFSIIHARIKYLRDAHAIPTGLAEIAAYYKRVFNTEQGKGSAEKFQDAWIAHDCWALLRDHVPNG